MKNLSFFLGKITMNVCAKNEIFIILGLGVIFNKAAGYWLKMHHIKTMLLNTKKIVSS